MAITESNIEALEMWLDGELPESQVEELRRQLSTDPELAQMLDRVRAQRESRSHLFQLLEPTEAEVEGLIADIRSGVRSEEIWARRVRSLKQLTKIAASIVIVFMAGWLSRDRVHVGSAPANEMIAAVPVVSPAGKGNVQMASMSQPITNNDGQIRFIQPPLEFRRVPLTQLASDARQVYTVNLIDPSGRVIGTQQIDLQGNPQGLVEQLGRFQTGLPSQSQSQRSNTIMVNSPEPAD
ncbi:MAG TPA: hypothetical protein VHD56_01620 [Tepidisphaeraceae bacterium]|nr:hypothetical protein [Tepidisphaeraceae bacterium]